MHSKYLKRFSNKIQLMYTHISIDIKFDDSVEISKSKKKELIDGFNLNNMDSQLLKELKTSIGSETNSEASSDISKSSQDSPSKLSETNLLLNSQLSSADIKTRSKSNSFISMNMTQINTTPINKKNFKQIFKNNVHKVTDMLQLCKPKKTDTIDQKISDIEIHRMFSGIEETCDSIIFETPKSDNIGLHIDSFDISEEKIDEDHEKKDDNIVEDNIVEDNIADDNIADDNIADNNIADNNIVEDNIAERKNPDENLINETIIDEKINIESVENEEKNVEQIVNHIEISEPLKKKRTYNRKKK
jgi:hypothetical protein